MKKILITVSMFLANTSLAQSINPDAAATVTLAQVDNENSVEELADLIEQSFLMRSNMPFSASRTEFIGGIHRIHLTIFVPEWYSERHGIHSFMVGSHLYEYLREWEFKRYVEKVHSEAGQMTKAQDMVTSNVGTIGH